MRVFAKRMVLLAFACAVLGGPRQASASALYVGVGGSTSGSSNSGYLGTFFNVSGPIEVTDLGTWDSGSPGLVNTHTVSLWENAGGNNWTQLASEVVSAGTVGGPDGFAYGPNTLSLVLLPGLYAIGTTYNSGDYSDLFPDSQVGGFFTSTGSDTTFAGGWAEVSNAFLGPGNAVFTSGSVFYGTSNMEYSPVPEPTSLVLLGTGLVGGYIRRRRRA